MAPSDDEPTARTRRGLTVACAWALLVWAGLPVGVQIIVTGRGIGSGHDLFFRASPLWEGLTDIGVGLIGLGLVVPFRRAASPALDLFLLLAAVSSIAAWQLWTDAALIVGIGASLALVWFYVAARRGLGDSPPEVHPRTPAAELVFYMLDSEDQDTVAADRILACRFLNGIDDFVSDYAPYLSVERAGDLIAQADALRASGGLDTDRRWEIDLLERRIRANGRAVVGYQLVPAER